MLPYKTGTVTITNGTAAVTGVGTFFKSNVAVGDLITVDYLHDYVIISVNSDTSVTLDRLFAEATVTGQAYLVKRVSSSWGMPAKLASDYTELTDQYRARWVAGKGPKGDKGDNSHIHIKWHSEGSEVLLDTPDAYIGIYADNEIADSEVYADYSWYLYKGPQGDAAPNTIFQYSINGTDWTGVATDAQWYRQSGDNGITWSEAIAIGITAYADGKIAQTITEDVTTTAPSEGAVYDALALKAPLASPTFTGMPTAPTASTGTNTTQIATTEFVENHFIASKNLFNKDTVTLSKFVSSSTGDLSGGGSYVASDYISILPDTDYYKSGDCVYPYHAWYDINKQFISAPANTRLIHSPENAYFYRFSAKQTAYTTVQLEKNSFATSFASFETKVDTGRISDNSVDGEKLIDLSISPIKTDFLSHGKNLFDKQAAHVGYVVHEGNGTIYANELYAASDYIRIEEATDYYMNGGRYLAFYDINKIFISGLGFGGVTINGFTSVARAAYVRVTCPVGKIDSFQVELGSIGTIYEDFGYELVRPLAKKVLFDVEIVLPDTLYAIVGQELNIYFDNIMNDKDTRYEYDVTCTVGQQYDNFYRLTPTTAGSYAITIDVYYNGVIVAEAVSTIIVRAAAVGSGVSKKILVIGDSTTANSIAITKLNANFDTDVMDIVCLGTKGTAPNQHEGISGWTIAQFYTNVASPFVFDGVFNFATYMSTNSYADVDYVVINLGINDVFTPATDIAVETATVTMLTRLQGMIDSIHSFNADIKIGLAITIPPAYDQSSFGKMYNCTYLRRRYKRNNFLWCKALIDEFSGQTASNVYLVPINTNLDTRYNMGIESLPVNARNTDVTTDSIIANGNVHPADSGYWQIADVYWYWLKSFEV